MRYAIGVVLVLGVLAAGAPPGPTGTLRGEIVSGRNAIAYAQVMVVAQRMGLLSDEEGRFSLPGVPIGVQRISVFALGYAKLDTTLTVVAGENPPLRLDLIDRNGRIDCDSCFWVDPYQGSRKVAAGDIDLSYAAEDWRASTRTRAGSLALASDPNPCRLQIDLSPAHGPKRGRLVIVDALGRDVHAFEFSGAVGIHMSWTGEGEDGRPLPKGSYRAVYRAGRDSVALGFERVHRPPPRL